MLVHPSSPTATGSERATLRRASTIGQQRAIARGLRSCHTRQDVMRPRATGTARDGHLLAIPVPDLRRGQGLRAGAGTSDACGQKIQEQRELLIVVRS